MKNWSESTIDLEIVKKIIKVTQMLFKSGRNSNYYSDQILVLKIMPIVMKAAKYYKDREEKGAHHNFFSFQSARKLILRKSTQHQGHYECQHE